MARPDTDAFLVQLQELTGIEEPMAEFLLTLFRLLLPAHGRLPP